MENQEEQKQQRRTKNGRKQQRRREEYSLAAAASNYGDELLQSKAGSESKSTDIEVKSVTEGFLGTNYLLEVFFKEL
ncbi:hypothetical protein RHMOL_Rhmol10G0070500 [Rhododendron molle]|uniref:Uncharacterized protein n=2 Tax=Rhododendron molle TaxID=49168 RepID=A0ACC0LZW2_RHOML|nr:hypothetical protein RHMOL_Rhmol10G0070400 [Rhododendron molle]KAI8534200.1 hypothetical protein RHMOL_Rhmol10G0070500 [Rhododendron molle]